MENRVYLQTKEEIYQILDQIKCGDDLNDRSYGEIKISLNTISKKGKEIEGDSFSDLIKTIPIDKNREEYLKYRQEWKRIEREKKNEKK